MTAVASQATDAAAPTRKRPQVRTCPVSWTGDSWGVPGLRFRSFLGLGYGVAASVITVGTGAAAVTDASQALEERLVGVKSREELSLRGGGIDSREELRGAYVCRYFFHITTKHDIVGPGVVARPANQLCAQEIRITGSSSSRAVADRMHTLR